MTAFMTLCTLLPFLPGQYDSLAAPLSLVMQVSGAAGLLLVPIGALWLATRRWSRLAATPHLFAIAALIVLSFFWLALSLGATVSGTLTAGIGGFALWGYTVRKVFPPLRRLASSPPAPATIALYLIVLPVAVALPQWTLVGGAVEFSRSRAIRNSAPLIADIEQYHRTNGRYPASLLAIWRDYQSSVIGIDRYYYEPSGDAYNLVFEQFRFRPLGTREYVVYNPRDEQVMTAHTVDLLRRTRVEQDLMRGHYAVHDAGHEHWKYFWFD